MVLARSIQMAGSLCLLLSAPSFASEWPECPPLKFETLRFNPGQKRCEIRRVAAIPPRLSDTLLQERVRRKDADLDNPIRVLGQNGPEYAIVEVAGLAPTSYLLDLRGIQYLGIPRLQELPYFSQQNGLGTSRSISGIMVWNEEALTLTTKTVPFDQEITELRHTYVLDRSFVLKKIEALPTRAFPVTASQVRKWVTIWEAPIWTIKGPYY